MHMCGSFRGVTLFYPIYKVTGEQTERKSTLFTQPHLLCDGVEHDLHFDHNKLFLFQAINMVCLQQIGFLLLCLKSESVLASNQHSSALWSGLLWAYCSSALLPYSVTEQGNSLQSKPSLQEAAFSLGNVKIMPGNKQKCVALAKLTMLCLFILCTTETLNCSLVCLFMKLLQELMSSFSHTKGNIEDQFQKM